MIHDADRSLAAWVGTMLPPGTAVRFDAPRPAWVRDPPEQAFVDVFLYDIAEDINGLSAEAALIRDPDGRPVAWQPQTRRYRLSYLLTAWSAEVSADHELLGSVMAGFAGVPVIPAEFLHGTLVDAGLPVEVQCAPSRDRGAGTTPAAGLCQALGVPPRAALALVVVAPLVPAPRAELAPPVRSLDLDMAVLAAPPGQQPPEQQSPQQQSPQQQPSKDQPPRPGQRGPQRRWERARITEHRG